MTGPHLATVIAAEIRKLFARTSTRIGLALALAIGLGVPLVRLLVRLAQGAFVQSVAESQGGLVPEMPPVDADFVVYATLWIRNFFFLRLIIILLAAVSFAGEYQSRTLREDLLRPVARWGLLLAKWVAIDVFVVATVVLVVAPASLVSMLAFGFDGRWGDIALAALATIAADIGFAALAIAIAVLTRNVAGTIVAMVLFYVIDFSIGLALTAAASLPFLQIPDWARETAAAAGPWLPSAAFGVWTGASASAPWSWQGFVSLGLITLLAAFVAERLFARMDVP